jgi:hypothetical protein
MRLTPHSLRYNSHCHIYSPRHPAARTAPHIIQLRSSLKADRLALALGPELFSAHLHPHDELPAEEIVVRNGRRERELGRVKGGGVILDSFRDAGHQLSVAIAFALARAKLALPEIPAGVLTVAKTAI